MLFIGTCNNIEKMKFSKSQRSVIPISEMNTRSSLSKQKQRERPSVVNCTRLPAIKHAKASEEEYGLLERKKSHFHLKQRIETPKYPRNTKPMYSSTKNLKKPLSLGYINSPRSKIRPESGQKESLVAQKNLD